ncbi:4-hydroxythreonine-4-phosphate dehydrogenase PdxA [Halalkalibaculum sp. DA3122]|uniref:4-hydroxythreonine-4-phosphate dehydrogenase PdxA n=1 Tax=Halalkalibaculum sp. DA3122 TaxID=3373607 RepID=UPI0037549D0F
MSVRIAISIGDYNGIGPEVVLKTLQNRDLGDCTPVILGDTKIIDYYLDRLNISLEYHAADSIQSVSDGRINILNLLSSNDIVIEPGKLSKNAGSCAMQAVETGIQLCLSGETAALVTASISKEAVNRAGYHIPGHTEFLAEKTRTKDFIMMMVNEGLRIGLISTHVPLKEAAGWISKERVTRFIRIISKSLTRDFGIERPRVAVLGLNPHAGDGGMIGREEIEVIQPAIEQYASGGINVEGPFPADGFFGSRNYRQFDGILAMYHDQGLIPFKTLSFGAGVNFTAGLPFIRTSPDHGTAFDIAGQGSANPASFRQAFDLAVSLAKKRRGQSA